MGGLVPTWHGLVLIRATLNQASTAPQKPNNPNLQHMHYPCMPPVATAVHAKCPSKAHPPAGFAAPVEGLGLFTHLFERCMASKKGYYRQGSIFGKAGSAGDGLFVMICEISTQRKYLRKNSSRRCAPCADARSGRRLPPGWAASRVCSCLQKIA